MSEAKNQRDEGLESSRCYPRRSKRWAKEELALLGSMSDEDVAEKTGRTVRSCQAKRVDAGKKKRERAGPWGERQLTMLGTNTDEMVAKKIGKTKNAVAKMRKKLGVRAFDSRGRRSGSRLHSRGREERL